MIIDGKAIAQDILARTKARASAFARTPRVIALVANETPATRSYLKIKARYAEDAGCRFEVKAFPEDVTAATLCAAAKDPDVDAVIVQLPLPPHIDSREVCDAIPLTKDADVLSSAARMKFDHDEPETLLPPVVAALAHILEFNQVDPKGRKAVVIGAGWLVGKPCATWLTHQGADVTHFTNESKDFSSLKDADIIVSGAGTPHLINPEMIKEGAILIDAGTSESGGTLVGDADPACASKCSLFTPVPGGVGPIAVACLFENVVALSRQ